MRSHDFSFIFISLKRSVPLLTKGWKYDNMEKIYLIEQERTGMSEQDEKRTKKKFNLYNLLNPERNDQQDAPWEDPRAPRDLKLFFKMLGRRFSTLVKLNILTIVGNFPIFFFFLVLAGYFSKTAVAPLSVSFPALYGAMQYGGTSPSAAALFGVHGALTTMRVFSLTDYILIGVGILLLLCTFGLVNCGVTYILRNIVKGEPVFLWLDFKDTVKKNLKQGILMGILDLLFLFLIVYDVLFFYGNLSGFLSSVLFWSAIFIGIFYLFMRMYLYVLLVTFDLRIFKIFKNSLIFSLLGFKRNILALLGILLAIALNYFLLNIFLPLGFIAPFLITVALSMFMMTYAAWPKIKEIMVDPYYNEDGSEKQPKAEA